MTASVIHALVENKKTTTLCGVFFIYGTLSIPPLENGLHFITRRIDNNNPLKIPCFSIEEYAYVEHVGKNLQKPSG
jgi:hypothetical protein